MDRQPRQFWILIIGFFLWLLAVLLVFYSVQKPLDFTNALALGDAVLNLATALGIVILATALGVRVLEGWPFPSRAERLIFSAGTGLGIFSITTLGLGMAGFLYPWLFWILGLALGVILRNQLLGLGQAVIELWTSFSLPRLFAIYLAVSLFVSLLAALTPSTSFDALLYHLEGPKLYLEEHRIFAFDSFPLYFPSLVEMLFLLAMGLKGEIAAQVIHFLYGLFLAFALYLFSRRHLSKGNAWWSVALVWSMPLVPLIMGWAYVDLALALYEFLALWALTRWMESQDTRFLILAGANAGWAMGVKYTAFVAPLALGLILIYHGRRHLGSSLPTIGRALGTLAFVVGLVAAPWYLRNLLLVGNPVYPFVFEGKFWDEWLAGWYEQPGSGLGLDTVGLLALPLTTTLGIRDTSFYDGRIGPLWLAFIPILIGVRFLPFWGEDGNKKRIANYLLFVFLVHFVFWTLGVMRTQSLFQSRLLLPALVFLSPALAYSVELVGRVATRSFSLQRFLTAVVALVLSLGLLTQTMEFLAHDPLPYLLGWDSKEGYLEVNLGDHYFAITAINEQLSESAAVQFLWEPRTFYCTQDCRPDPVLATFKHLAYLHGSAPAIVQSLKTQGITHILVDEWGRNFQQDNPRTGLTPAEEAMWETLTKEYLQPIYSDGNGNYTLYLLR